MKSIGQQLNAKIKGDNAATLYSHFEPWDVEERCDEIMEQAVKDDIDLFRDDYVKTNNIAPHPFQSGFILSTHKTRASVAGSRTGKSYPIFIEIGCMCSGEFPIALQYNKGVDTGVKRTPSYLNVQRWGRRDTATGVIIDYNTSYPDDGSWDCGTIIGAGKYPKEKVIPDDLDGLKEDRTIWVGTTATALAESWWPKLTEDGARVLPEKFIDKTKGNNGANSSTSVIYLKNDIRLSIISYESGHRKFEAITAWACFFDEEPPDRRCVSAAQSHCKYFSLTMTPLLGMSYTKDLIFKKQHPSKIVFQANTYDSPYVSEVEIDQWRSDFPEDEIGARVWGDHTAEAKTPYYVKRKIKGWINQFFDMEQGFTAVFQPSEPCFGLYRRRETNLPGIMDVTISLVPVEYDEDDPEKPPSVWRIYEDRKEGGAYFMPADCANGADLPEDVGDMETALVLRFPIADLGETKPVIVAELVTTVPPDQFAIETAYVLNYYNFALLCGESNARGAANGMFYSEMKTYKYWYMHMSRNQRSKKLLEKKGFDTNTATRKPLFDELTAWFSDYEADEYPDIPSEAILTMAMECIRTIQNGKVRPDHPKGKNNDLLVCFGIGLWIFKTFPEQIKCRREKKEATVDQSDRKMVRRMLQAAGKLPKSGESSGFFPKHKGRTR